MKIKTDFLLPALVLFSGNSFAFDWLFEPDMNFSERYEDNLRLTPNPSRDNLISTLSPGLKFGYLSENNDLNANLKWNELIYHGESSLDFSEKIANIEHHYSGERFKTDLSLDYALQSSLSTQLDATGSGFLGNQVPRTNRSFTPNVTYSLTERNSLQLGYSYVDVSFDKPQSLDNNVNFSDYSSKQYSATATHMYTERLSFNLTGAYSEFDSSNDTNGQAIDGVKPVLDANGQPIFFAGQQLFENNIVNSKTTFSQKSTTLNYQAGLQYAFSEQMQLSVSAGIRNTDTTTTQQVTRSDSGKVLGNISQSGTTSGHVFSASFSRASDWGSFSLNAGQQLNPASTGTQQQSTSLSANVSYNLAERWATGISASYLISESVSTANNDNNSGKRTYATLSPHIRWRWTPEINLEFSYSHRQQQYQSSVNQSAIGNTVQLQFSYQPQINRQVK